MWNANDPSKKVLLQRAKASKTSYVAHLPAADCGIELGACRLHLMNDDAQTEEEIIHFGGQPTDHPLKAFEGLVPDKIEPREVKPPLSKARVAVAVDPNAAALNKNMQHFYLPKVGAGKSNLVGPGNPPQQFNAQYNGMSKFSMQEVPLQHMQQQTTSQVMNPAAQNYASTNIVLPGPRNVAPMSREIPAGDFQNYAAAANIHQRMLEAVRSNPELGVRMGQQPATFLTHSTQPPTFSGNATAAHLQRQMGPAVPYQQVQGFDPHLELMAQVKQALAGPPAGHLAQIPGSGPGLGGIKKL